MRDVALAYSPLPGENELPKADPLRNIYSSDITCGRNAFAAAGTTETATVIAGEEVGFRVSMGGREEYASAVSLIRYFSHQWV